MAGPSWAQAWDVRMTRFRDGAPAVGAAFLAWFLISDGYEAYSKLLPPLARSHTTPQ